MQLTAQEQALLVLYAGTTEEIRTMEFYNKCMQLFKEQAQVVDIDQKQTLKKAI
jgi:hypothetical protein